MKLRLMGTEAECARLTFLLRFGPPDLEAHRGQPALSQPRRQRARSASTWRSGSPRDWPRPSVTFYSLILPDGGGLLVDAWGQEVDA